MLLGLAGCALLLPGPRVFHGVGFDVHTLLYAFVSVLLGFQLIAFATFTKVFAITEGLLPEDPRLNRVFRWVTLETGLVFGGLLMFWASADRSCRSPTGPERALARWTPRTCSASSCPLSSP